jgi:hypothetical protein
MRLSVTQIIRSDRAGALTNNKLEAMKKKAVVPNMRCILTLASRIGETHIQISSQDTWFSGRDSNCSPPEYKLEASGLSFLVRLFLLLLSPHFSLPTSLHPTIYSSKIISVLILFHSL